MGLLLGDVVPDFEQDSTEGKIRFAPVCTTELGQVAKLKGEFDKRGVKAIAVSVDSVEDH